METEITNSMDTVLNSKQVLLYILEVSAMHVWNNYVSPIAFYKVFCLEEYQVWLKQQIN